MPTARTRHLWKIRETEIPLGAATALVGVVDVSSEAVRGAPDAGETLERAERAREAGAVLVEITALPSPAKAVRLTADDELRRLVPALRKFRAQLGGPFAVGTYNAETATRAIELGAAAIRDPTGLALDPAMPAAIGAADVGLVVGHSFGGPETWGKGRPLARLFETVRAELDSAVARARRAGVDRRRIVVDPGLEFGKRGAQNWDLLERLPELAPLGQPIAVGASRRQFLTATVRASRMESLMAEAVAVGLAVRGGAHLVRANDVAEIRAAAEAADRLLEAIEARG